MTRRLFWKSLLAACLATLLVLGGAAGILAVNGDGPLLVILLGPGVLFSMLVGTADWAGLHDGTLIVTMVVGTLLFYFGLFGLLALTWHRRRASPAAP